jgi:hypothetical protein
MLKFYEEVKLKDEIYPWHSEYQEHSSHCLGC